MNICATVDGLKPGPFPEVHHLWVVAGDWGSNRYLYDDDDGGGVDDDDDDGGGGGGDDDNGDSTILYLPMVHDIVFLVVHNIVFTGPNVVLYLLEGLTNRSHYCSDFALSYHFKYFQ